MNNWQRVFTYATGSLVIGLLFIVLTNSFLYYVDVEGSTGLIALLAYGFIFLNLGFGINRRFALKARRVPVIHYTLAFLIVAPTLAWTYTRPEDLGESYIIFVGTITFAVLLGTYYGIKMGGSRREKYLKEVEEQLRDEETPEELRRPHDDISKN